MREAKDQTTSVQAQEPPLPKITLMPQKWGCAMSCSTKTSKQENKRVFPASIIMGGREGLCSGLCSKLLQADPCLGSVLYSDPDMASAKGIHRYSQYCSRIPALRGTARSDAGLELLLELQDLLVSLRQASVWPILSLISPTAESYHFPTAQSMSEEGRGEPLGRLAFALSTQNRPL